MEVAELVLRRGCPEFSLRLVFALEVYGFAAYAESFGKCLSGDVIGAINFDAMGGLDGAVYPAAPGTPFFGNALLEILLNELKDEPELCRGSPYEKGEMPVNMDFPDPEHLLDTALRALAKLRINGFSVEIRPCGTGCLEEYLLETDGCSARISASDTEGIRRGIYQLIDLFRAAPSPSLEKRSYRKKPWLKTRISRGFFSPVKRPPLNRDELLEDYDYYPDAYLDRLASEGVNGLWIGIEFHDLCRTALTPDHGQNAGRRLRRLQRIAGRCRLYGIKIYLFAIEPDLCSFDGRALAEHPELAGPAVMDRLNDSLDELFVAIDNISPVFPWITHVSAAGMKYVLPGNSGCEIAAGTGWSATFRIPEPAYSKYLEHNRLRLNIIHLNGSYGAKVSWPKLKTVIPSRLNLVFYHPANMGTVIFP